MVKSFQGITESEKAVSLVEVAVSMLIFLLAVSMLFYSLPLFSSQMRQNDIDKMTANTLLNEKMEEFINMGYEGILSSELDPPLTENPITGFNRFTRTIDFAEVEPYIGSEDSFMKITVSVKWKTSENKDSIIQASTLVMPHVVSGYLIFHASTKDNFVMDGYRNTVNGKSQVNYIPQISGQNNHFNDIFQSVKKPTAHSSTVFVNLAYPSPALPMPKYDIYTLKSKATLTYPDNVTFEGSIPNGIIYVNGNVTIKGTGFSGQGTIISTGDINVQATYFQYDSGNEEVAFYSLHKIFLDGARQTIKGTLYAPYDIIEWKDHSDYCNFFGRLIAKKVKISGEDNILTFR